MRATWMAAGGMLAALAVAVPAAAQVGTDTAAVAVAPSEGPLPAEVVDRVIAFYNDPGTIHFSGRTRIPAERTVTGAVAVLGGPLVVAGRISGDVVVVNGHVELLPGAAIDGALTVVGGQAAGLDGARVAGPVQTYAARLDYDRDGDTLYARRMLDDDVVVTREAMELDDYVPLGQEEEEPRSDGRADFVVATGQSYNRVEGLPITFGPVLQTSSSNPTRLRGTAIYRTEEGFALGPGRWGYEVRLDQFLGGQRTWRVGVGARSTVDPVEAWHVSKLENGLATFFLHRDYRDHYERRGWSAWAGWAPVGGPLSATLELRSEKHATAPAGSPWTLFDNDEPWRPQPLAAEGRLKSLVLRTEYDTRSDADDPATGWHVEAQVEQTFGTELVRPGAAFPLPGGPPPAPLAPETFDDFAAATVDLRRYNRLGPSSRLDFRLLAGGSLDGSALPPQRQHALGGEGSLPGYDLFRLDCGARRLRVNRPRDLAERAPNEIPPLYHPDYGCDRFALFQAQFRGDLAFRFNWSSDWEEDEGYEAEAAEGRAGPRLPLPGSWNADFAWVAFVDVGRGWVVDSELDEDTAVDVGFGLLFGKLGVYGAIPLEGGNGVNLFVRLAPRF